MCPLRGQSLESRLAAQPGVLRTCGDAEITALDCRHHRRLCARPGTRRLVVLACSPAPRLLRRRNARADRLNCSRPHALSQRDGRGCIPGGPRARRGRQEGGRRWAHPTRSVSPRSGSSIEPLPPVSRGWLSNNRASQAWPHGQRDRRARPPLGVFLVGSSDGVARLDARLHRCTDPRGH